MLVKIISVDNGFCRVNYVAKNDADQNVYYCIQDEGNNDVQFYRCTGQPWCEPNYTIKCSDWSIIEIPTGDSEIEITVRDFLNKKLKEI